MPQVTFYGLLAGGSYLKRTIPPGTSIQAFVRQIQERARQQGIVAFSIVSEAPQLVVTPPAGASKPPVDENPIIPPEFPDFGGDF
jgi:hypothetical protein